MNKNHDTKKVPSNASYNQIKKFLQTNDWFLCEEVYAKDYLNLTVLCKILIDSNQSNAAYSILFRAGMEKELKEFSLTHCDYIPNDLWQNDCFQPYGWRLPNLNKNQFLNQRDFGITIDKVYYVEDKKGNNQLDYAVNKQLKKFMTIGFYCQSSGENSNVHLLQFATGQEIFLFNGKALAENQIFLKFQKEFFEREDIYILAYNFRYQLLKLLKSFPELKIDSPKNIADISNFIMKIDGSKIHIDKQVKGLLKKTLCIYNEKSNWLNSPLRRAQAHYAALNAYMLFPLYKSICKRDLRFKHLYFNGEKWVYWDEWLKEQLKTVEKEIKDVQDNFDKFQCQVGAQKKKYVNNKKWIETMEITLYELDLQAKIKKPDQNSEYYYASLCSKSISELVKIQAGIVEKLYDQQRNMPEELSHLLTRQRDRISMMVNLYKRKQQIIDDKKEIPKEMRDFLANFTKNPEDHNDKVMYDQINIKIDQLEEQDQEYTSEIAHINITNKILIWAEEKQIYDDEVKTKRNNSDNNSVLSYSNPNIKSESLENCGSKRSDSQSEIVFGEEEIKKKLKNEERNDNFQKNINDKKIEMNNEKMQYQLINSIS